MTSVCLAKAIFLLLEFKVAKGATRKLARDVVKDVFVPPSDNLILVPGFLLLVRGTFPHCCCFSRSNSGFLMIAMNMI